MVGYTNHIAKQGRRGDTMVAHVTKGETIVPKPVLDKNPDLVMHIAHAIRNAGANPDHYTVGKDMSINPDTGHPEFGFFNSLFKNKIFRTVAPIVLGAINPALGAAAGGIMGASNGGGIMGGLTGAAGGYFGGSALSGGISGLSTAPLSGIGPVGQGGISGFLSGASGGASNAASALGGALGIGGSTMGGASKFLQAASLASSIGSPKTSQPSAAGPGTAAPAAYKPVMPGAMNMPSSLNQMSAYSPEQMRSALATQGINGGLGKDEQSYYTNLLQRSLIGPGNKVNTSNPNFLMPIESQYFSQRGLNTSDPTQFLSGLNGMA